MTFKHLVSYDVTDSVILTLLQVLNELPIRIKLHIASVTRDSSSLTNEKDHHYFLNSADVCW